MECWFDVAPLALLFGCLVASEIFCNIHVHVLAGHHACDGLVHMRSLIYKMDQALITNNRLQICIQNKQIHASHVF